VTVSQSAERGDEEVSPRVEGVDWTAQKVSRNTDTCILFMPSGFQNETATGRKELELGFHMDWNRFLWICALRCVDLYGFPWIYIRPDNHMSPKDTLVKAHGQGRRLRAVRRAVQAARSKITVFTSPCFRQYLRTSYQVDILCDSFMATTLGTE
jgi:hypothetical protein